MYEAGVGGSCDGEGNGRFIKFGTMTFIVSVRERDKFASLEEFTIITVGVYSLAYLCFFFFALDFARVMAEEFSTMPVAISGS